MLETHTELHGYVSATAVTFPSLRGVPVNAGLDLATWVRNHVKAHKGLDALPHAQDSLMPSSHLTQAHAFSLSAHRAVTATTNPMVKIWSTLSLPQSQVFIGGKFFFFFFQV